MDNKQAAESIRRSVELWAEKSFQVQNARVTYNEATERPVVGRMERLYFFHIRAHRASQAPLMTVQIEFELHEKQLADIMGDV